MLHNGIAVYGYIAMAQLYSDDLLRYFRGIHCGACGPNSTSEGNSLALGLKTTEVCLIDQTSYRFGKDLEKSINVKIDKCSVEIGRD